MKLEKLHLSGFRNHRKTEIGCSPTVNLFVGRNGQGKTNMLEAIAYLSLGKSFFSTPDTTLVRRGEDGFVLYGSFRSDNGTTHTVGIQYTERTKRKEVRLNNKDEERISTLIGRFPVVLLYPEQHSITNGGPGERRRFMDMVLSQAHPGYFEMLTEYRKILKQRNAVLTDYRSSPRQALAMLEPWNDTFLEYAVGITGYRMDFIREIGKKLSGNYAKIAGNAEIPSLQYDPAVPYDDANASAMREKTSAAFRETFDTETRYGTTVFGPHRDELVLHINGMEVRKFASQGQQKSFLVALKIAESQYLLEKRNEQPLILLDDLFGELDRDRSKCVLELTTGMGQTFVTSADETISQTHYTALNGHIKYKVESGTAAHV
jgi:DNA replication and repair protein RecF